MGDDIEILDVNNGETSAEEFKIESKIDLEDTSDNSKEVKHKSKKRGTFRIIGIIILSLAIILIIIETFIGIVDVRQIKDNKQPMWYLNSDIRRDESQKITTYDLGLYVIEKKESKTEIKIVLKPFFMK